MIKEQHGAIHLDHHLRPNLCRRWPNLPDNPDTSRLPLNFIKHKFGFGRGQNMETIIDRKGCWRALNLQFVLFHFGGYLFKPSPLRTSHSGAWDNDLDHCPPQNERRHSSLCTRSATTKEKGKKRGPLYTYGWCTAVWSSARIFMAQARAPGGDWV